MTSVQTDGRASRRPLRVWPGVVAVALQWLAWLGAPAVFSGPAAGYVAVFGGFLGGVAVVAWWPAIEGKTWNHPVLARDLLLARNGQEMVAFRLPAAAP